MTLQNLLNRPFSDSRELEQWMYSHNDHHKSIVEGIAFYTSFINKITFSSAGSGYISAPIVVISGGGPGATGAVITVTVSAGSINSVKIVNSGRGYTQIPTISFSGGGGSGAAATVTISKPTRLTMYQIYPFSPTGVGEWLINHQNFHDDMNRALSISGVDLQTVDFQNQAEADLWVDLNFREHLSAAKKLGLK
jgi:hypothetical protein